MCRKPLKIFNKYWTNKYLLNKQVIIIIIMVGSSLLPLSKDRTFAYYCTENEYNKDSNLVASSVFHRLSHTYMTGIKYVRLVMDGCGGQHKNCILVTLHSNQNFLKVVLPCKTRTIKICLVNLFTQIKRLKRTHCCPPTHISP